MSIPKKILHYLGYNTLGLMMDQDRKHWLMRVDKNKSIQDKNTGEIFRGVIDNAGSDIVIESQKSPVTYEWFASMKYENENLSYILEPCNSAFTFSISVVGLMFARIKSINYPSSITNPNHRIYRMKLDNCEECIIAFGNDTQSSDVFAGRWLKTTTPPTIQAMDNNGNYTINVSTRMNGCTNTIYYYPLNENIQPFELTYDSGSYYTSAIDDNGYIGLPLYWYTCDESKTGPTISIENNASLHGLELCILGNPGNESKYVVDAFVNVDGNNNATPDDVVSSYYKILCHPLIENSFINSDEDFESYIDFILFHQKHGGKANYIGHTIVEL